MVDPKTTTTTTGLATTGLAKAPEKLVIVSKPATQEGTATAGTNDTKETAWLKSTSKCIYFISETDCRTGETRDIGYCRTKAEADHLIYDWGQRRYKEHLQFREEKKKYHVTYSYVVEDESTRFEVKERSLGYFYNGPLVTRFSIKFNKLFRSYNSVLTPSDLQGLRKTNEEVA
jgi:hypothetical protein